MKRNLVVVQIAHLITNNSLIHPQCHSPKEEFGSCFSMTVQGWQLEPRTQQQRESRVRGMELRRQQDYGVDGGCTLTPEDVLSEDLLRHPKVVKEISGCSPRMRYGLFYKVPF